MASANKVTQVGDKDRHSFGETPFPPEHLGRGGKQNTRWSSISALVAHEAVKLATGNEAEMTRGRSCEDEEPSEGKCPLRRHPAGGRELCRPRGPGLCWHMEEMALNEETTRTSPRAVLVIVQDCAPRPLRAVPVSDHDCLCHGPLGHLLALTGHSSLADSG